MSSQQDMIRSQAKKHPFVNTKSFTTIEEYCLHLIHRNAYDEAAKMAHNKTVLDLGCNTGYGTRVLGVQAKEVIGVDMSPQVIAEARRRFGANGIQIRLVDGICLPFEDQKFDLVVSFQVIEHITDYDIYLSETKRVLAPGGIVMFTTPNARIRLDSDMKPWNRFHVREFGAYELAELLQTYFPRVVVRGLFASEYLYAVELNRVKNEREAARRRTTWNSDLRWKLKSILPDRVVRQLKRARRRLSSGMHALDPAIIQSYSTADFYYRDEDLDEALDLMAICYKHGS